MKSKQYFISTTTVKIEVKGYPVVIPGFDEFSFFLHRPILKRGWVISEETTGFNCMPDSWAGGMSNSTRAGALAIVIERFKSTGHELIKERLKREIGRVKAALK